MSKMYLGGCHCGAVRFRFYGPEKVRATRCNCSICRNFGYLHFNIPKESFQLIKGEGFLTEYRFNSKNAAHFFCKICGVKSFYQPRSHPDRYSVNVNCLDDVLESQCEIFLFDGVNWDENVEEFQERI